MAAFQLLYCLYNLCASLMVTIFPGLYYFVEPKTPSDCTILGWRERPCLLRLSTLLQPSQVGWLSHGQAVDNQNTNTGLLGMEH